MGLQTPVIVAWKLLVSLDWAILALSISLTHMFVNVRVNNTTGAGDCPMFEWVQGFVSLLVTAVVATLQIVARNSLRYLKRKQKLAEYRKGEYLKEKQEKEEAKSLIAAKGGLGIIIPGYLRANMDKSDAKQSQDAKDIYKNHYAYGQPLYLFLEFFSALFFIAAGAFLQIQAKPEGWGVALYKPGCDLMESPPAAMAWLLGEVMSFGYGARLFLLVWVFFRKCGWWRTGYIAVFVLFGIALAAGWLMHVYLTPVLEEIYAPTA